MPALASVCVFCGSSPGRGTTYLAAARELGRLLASRGITLVYGGAGVGLMRALADGALDQGGRVTGVIPRTLIDREIAHDGLNELVVVETMHERKARMSDLADAFIALPGGMGTLDELAEAITWNQLGIHAKPCGLLDVDGYFGPLLAFLERATAEQFLRAGDLESLIVEQDAGMLLDRLAVARPQATKEALGRPPPP